MENLLLYWRIFLNEYWNSAVNMLTSSEGFKLDTKPSIPTFQNTAAINIRWSHPIEVAIINIIATFMNMKCHQ